MSEERIDSLLEKSLFEFQQYLSDQLPPLVVSDSIELLLKADPKLMATSINAWVSGQLRSGKVRLSDYYFHAVKKVHLMGEYHLVPQQELADFLKRLKPIVLRYCPPAEQELLRQSMDRMADAPESIAAPVEVLYRQGGGSEATDRSVSAVEAAPEVERLGLLMQRIEKEVAAISASGEGDPGGRHQQVVSEALAQAALSTQMTMELERTLEHLKRLGVRAGTED